MQLYNEYNIKIDALRKKMRIERFDDITTERKKIADIFQKECSIICTNEDELCNIVIDICYQKEHSKQFAWDICGKQIIKNLLKRNNNITYPRHTDSLDYDFEYMGIRFIMKNLTITDEIEI